MIFSEAVLFPLFLLICMQWLLNKQNIKSVQKHTQCSAHISKQSIKLTLCHMQMKCFILKRIKVCMSWRRKKPLPLHFHKIRPNTMLLAIKFFIQTQQTGAMSDATKHTGQHGIGFLKLIQVSSNKIYLSRELDINSCKAMILMRNRLKVRQPLKNRDYLVTRDFLCNF